MRYEWWVRAALLATCCVARGQEKLPAASYAIFSPTAIAGLAAEHDSAAAQKAVQTAKRFVDGTPDPMPVVHTEGTLPHTGIHDQSSVAEHDWDGMLALGLAYRLTGDKRYLASEEKYLSAWAGVYRASMNPIDETRLDNVMMGFELTRDGLSATTVRKALALWRAMAEGYTHWMEQNGSKDPANWSSHRVKLAVMTAYEVGDAKLEARAAAVFHEQVERNIRPDGSVEDFYKRDALHYVVYDLEPLQMAVLTARVHGQDWFDAGKGGKTVDHAVEWLVPYQTGVTKHQEFVHSKVGFDAARDKAGEKGYSGEWNAANGVTALGLAAMLNPKYGEPLQKCLSLTGKSVEPWMQLLAGSHSAAGAK